MKKIFSAVLAATMLICLCAVSASALTEADISAFKATTLEQVSSGLDNGYDDFLEFGQYCMRGFAASPDGKYLFGGFLNPSNASAIVMWDNMTGKPAGYYQFMPTEGTDRLSYPKGLACDDRGYLYAGLAYNPNNGYAHLNIIKYDEKGSDDFMKTVSSTQIISSGEAKTGVNGVAVEALGGSYYCYVVINYDIDWLYRYDVTDPEKPVLDATFGTEGRVNLQELETVCGKVTEGNYLDVDDDGTIFMGYTAANGAGLMKLSSDGKTVLVSVNQTKGYGVAVFEDLVFCSTQSAPSEIVIYSKTTLDKFSSFTITDDKIVLPYEESLDLMIAAVPNSVVGMNVCSGCLFIADQGSNSVADQIFAVALNADGEAVLKAAVDARVALAKEIKGADTTAEATTAKDAEPTAPVTENTTDGPSENTTAGTPDVTTSAPASDTTNAADDGKKGCGSFAGSALVIASVLGGCLIKKKNS